MNDIALFHGDGSAYLLLHDKGINVQIMEDQWNQWSDGYYGKKAWVAHVAWDYGHEHTTIAFHTPESTKGVGVLSSLGFTLSEHADVLPLDSDLAQHLSDTIHQSIIDDMKED